MDPLSAVGLAANAAQLAEWAFRVFYNLARYYCNVRGAPQRSRELREELNSLTELLRELEDTFRQAPAIELPKTIDKEFRAIYQLLDKLFHRTDTKETKGLKQLRWPFLEAENNELIGQIGRFKENLNISLQNTQM